ncbi:MAG TPA: pseudouridine synthase [Longimicrobiales bacterium]
MSEMRLQKFLSRAGVASRRAAEAIIREGRVRVNGRVVTELGAKVDPDADAVEVDGRRVRTAPPLWVALNKPPGYVSTRRDPQRRPTVYDLVPADFSSLFHVGRLDAESEGLMLLTNQGDIAHRLLHPRYGVDRVYTVETAGDVDDAALRRLREGVRLEDGPARVAAVERRGSPAPGRSRLRVTMREGRKREVRRLFDAIGHPVERLVRIRYGPIRLGRLASGAWRRLSEREVAALEATARGER